MRVLAQMGRARSPSASTQSVDVQNGLARTIWSSEREVTPGGSSGLPKVTGLRGARGKWVVFQNPRLSWVALQPRRGGSAEDYREYYKEGWSPSFSPPWCLGESR